MWLEASVPFHLVIAFESYSKIFKDEIKQSKAQAALQLGALWGTDVSQASPSNPDGQADRQINSLEAKVPRGPEEWAVPELP